MTKAQFLEKAPKAAATAAERLGINPMLLVAQAALESGWGERTPKFADGAETYNVLGIKAGKSWLGARVMRNTHEWDKAAGQYVPTTALWRAYSSLRDCFDDYADIITHRYHVKTSSTPEEYMAAIVAGGYATEPAYAERVLGIYRQLTHQAEREP